MKTLHTKIITIEYTNSHEYEANKLKEVFNKNPLFFETLLSPTKVIRFTDEITLDCDDALEITCIEDLKQYLLGIVIDFIPKFKVTQKPDQNINEIMYLKYLILDKLNAVTNYNPEFENRTDLEEYIMIIYSLIASDYYDEPIDFIDSLFTMDNTEKTLLYDYLNDKRRFDLLNHLLEEQYDFLMNNTDENEQKNQFIKNYIVEICEIAKTKCSFEENEKNTLDLPKMSADELDSLLREFLITIDPSLKWLKIYEKLKEENIIIYGNSKLEDKIAWECKNIDGNWYINAPLTGTIRDFKCMIHELVHYVTLINDKDQEQSLSLKEYPPILFEIISIEYLRKKGFSEDLVEVLLEEREEWTRNNKFNVLPTLQYLKEFLTTGPITFKKIKQKEDALVKDIIDQIGNDFSKKNTYDKIILACDLQNSAILIAPMSLHDEYPYIIGHYLSKKTLERLKEEPKLLYEVLDITENLKDITPEEVITRLGLSAEEFNLKKKRQYQKK